MPPGQPHCKGAAFEPHQSPSATVAACGQICRHACIHSLGSRLQLTKHHWGAGERARRRQSWQRSSLALAWVASSAATQHTALSSRFSMGTTPKLEQISLASLRRMPSGQSCFLVSPSFQLSLSRPLLCPRGGIFKRNLSLPAKIFSAQALKFAMVSLPGSFSRYSHQPFSEMHESDKKQKRKTAAQGRLLLVLWLKELRILHAFKVHEVPGKFRRVRVLGWTRPLSTGHAKDKADQVRPRPLVLLDGQSKALGNLAAT